MFVLHGIFFRVEVPFKSLVDVTSIKYLGVTYTPKQGRRKQFNSGGALRAGRKFFCCAPPLLRGASPFERALQK